MKFFTIHIAILIILVEYSFSNEEQNPCEFYDFLHEIAQIPKFDSTKHSLTAKYCLNYDSGWVLLHYEQIIPLKAKIQKECETYSFSGEISLEPSGTFFNQIFGGFGSCMAYTIINPNKKLECKIDMNEHCHGCTENFVLGYCFDKERDNVSYLFDKYLPLKLSLRVSCDDEKIQIPSPENYYIYISGICNEEQLKKIETLNKARKKE